jgi:hypothetical protein
MYFLFEFPAANCAAELGVVIVVRQHLLRGESLGALSALEIFPRLVDGYFMVAEMRR